MSEKSCTFAVEFERKESLMAIVESKISRPDITSATKMEDVVSKLDVNPVSKTDFNPVSKYEGPMPTSTYHGDYIRMMVEENAKICDLTMEEIIAECEAVRQEMYDREQKKRCYA